ncbi:MAG: hypothetical protein ACXWQQ_11495 [Pseudobdellovibrio sp.]
MVKKIINQSRKPRSKENKRGGGSIPPPPQCLACLIPGSSKFVGDLSDLCPFHLGGEYHQTLKKFFLIKDALDEANELEADLLRAQLFPIIARLEMIEELIQKDALKRGLK